MGLLLAYSVAFIAAAVLISFAKFVLTRPAKSSSSASFGSGSSSALSLDDQRQYQQQLLRRRKQQQPTGTSAPTPAENKPTETKSVMQPVRTDLAPPKDDPFTVEHLKQFDGSDESKPIYVAIKGTVFDVSHKADTYGKGKSYNLFAGKDASRALGMSSLKPEDAHSDYSMLSPTDMKTLNDWYDFFSKRYNIIGKVVDLPPPGETAPSAL